ncbi:MAG: hypothetical protein IPO95_07200 [Rhodanobacteraceae bacterium]|nr:hypothetical protein [Rhodanobacteraceae bacterium]
MTRHLFVVLAVLLAACAHAPTSAPVAPVVDERAQLQSFREHYAALKAAARGDDVVLLLREADATHALAPEVPMVTYLRALAQAANVQNEAALDSLSQLAETGLAFDIGASPAFADLRSDSRFELLVQRFAANGLPRGPIDLAFTASGLPTDFVPESIVRDEVNRRWLLGSVRHARIDAVDGRGAAYDFVASGDGGLLSALGMRLVGNTVWVASAGFADTAGIAKDDIGRSGLFEIDASRGAVRRSWMLPDDGQPHALGDVLVLGSDVYASDSIGGGVYRLDARRESLQPLVATGLLMSPQGIAEHAGNLVVADYPSGLWHVSIDDASMRKLRAPSPAALTGIDGLYAHEGDLIAIQNGTTPKRILRIVLDKGGNAITRVDVLAQNLFGWGEPSLATIHDGALYYIANSQWDRFDAEGNLPPTEQLEAPRIMRLPLD